MKKYIYTFLITLAIFTTAIYLSNYFNNKKVDQVKNTESKISIDILASETQFALLGEASCKDLENSTLSRELSILGDRLSSLENNSGNNSDEFDTMKKYYSVLEIKDFLLTKKLGAKCANKPVSVLFFYSNNCLKCTEQGYALTSLHKKYSMLRVYSFDYNLDLPIIKTLAGIYDVTPDLPAIIIDGKMYTEFKNIDEMEAALPKSIRSSISSSTATTVKTIIK